MVTRTWACLNKNCKLMFDAVDVDYPPCPRCGGVHTKWQPRPFGIMKESTKFATRTAEKLAQDYGLTNFHTPEFGRPAIMKEAPIKRNFDMNVNEAMEARKIGVQQQNASGGVDYEAPGMPGWKAKIPVNSAGQPIAACMTTGVTAKLAGQIASGGESVSVPGGKANPILPQGVSSLRGVTEMIGGDKK